MHVGIMGRSVRPGATGVGRFAENIIRSLAETLPRGELTVFLTQDAPPFGHENVREIRAPWPTPNEYARMLWEHLVVPRQVRAQRIEVYHSPNYILPLGDLGCPMLVTVHDLSFRHVALHRIRSHLYLSLMTNSAVRRARSIIADSEHSRREIEQAYPRTHGRVQVIYGGLAPGLKNLSSQEIERFRTERGLDRPVILYVGTLEPRKNLARLVHAYEQAVEKHQLPHDLVLLGPPGWRMDSLQRTIRQSPLRPRIRLPGYAYDGELSAWYSIADLMAYPSLDEGFGLPVLEAMALGTPVVTSNISALPEVVGEAALQVDPYDTETIATAIGKILTRPELADRLRRAGRLQAGQFTWAAAAQKHVEAYARALNGADR